MVIDEESIDAQAADRVDQLLAFIPNVQLGSGRKDRPFAARDSTGVVRELFAFLCGARPTPRR